MEEFFSFRIVSDRFWSFNMCFPSQNGRACGRFGWKYTTYRIPFGRNFQMSKWNFTTSNYLKLKA